MMDAGTKKFVRARLRYVAGQLNLLERMVASDRRTTELLHQLSAAQGGLRAAVYAVLRAHTRSIMHQVLESDSDADRLRHIQQLTAVIARITRASDG